MQHQAFPNARVLIVDAEPQNISVLSQMLDRWDVKNIVGTADPFQTISLFQTFRPDIILLDLMMPGLDGFKLLEQLAPLVADDDFVPILILTADTRDEAKRCALTLGAADFLTKPFDAVELSLCIQNLMSRRMLHLRLQAQNHALDQQVQERTLQLIQAEIDTAECLARAAEYRDDDTGHHTQRVGQMSERLATLLGLSNTEITLIKRAAPLHDVGKIVIPDRILLKPDNLTEEEFVMIKTHTVIGYEILSRHHTALLQLAASIALTHHERFDGRGYPNNLAGEDIPLAGRIVAVADVGDALTHKRPYKRAWSVEEAVTEIQKQGNAQFDPNVVEKFSLLIDQDYKNSQAQTDAAVPLW